MFISSTEDLANYCDHASQSAHLFLDTEFMRERTYYAHLCLIQIITDDGEAVAIDPLAKNISLEPFYNLLAQTHITKILHACRQDIEIFVQHMPIVPAPIFDTQIAAMILGLGEQIGYEALVRYCLGIGISKHQQFTDWSKRPLSDAQYNYALDDVRYLRECYPILRQQLEAKGRTSWVEDESSYLYDRSLYHAAPEEVWQKLRKRDKKPHYRARLQKLAAWRERYAMRKDIPRSRVMHDDTLQEIALNNPSTLDELRHVRNLHRNLPVHEIMQILHEVNLLGADACPPKEAVYREESEDLVLRDALKLLLKIKAKEHNVSPNLLCPREMMDALVNGEPLELPANNWRYDMFFHEAYAFLGGTTSMCVRDGALHLYTT
ncbi:MAG: ribonuclease D [Alphaproteobacteria bacterium]|nr:MAG: ribonuclease D [Alphaproteobacteria bacterium]